MELPLPVAESGEEAAADERPQVTLNVLADGRLVLAGRFVSTDELRRRLAEERTRHEGLRLRIRCDRSAPYRQVAPALTASAEAGVWDAALAVRRVEEAR